MSGDVEGLLAWVREELIPPCVGCAELIPNPAPFLIVELKCVVVLQVSAYSNHVGTMEELSSGDVLCTLTKNMYVCHLYAKITVIRMNHICSKLGFCGLSNRLH